MGNYLRFDMGKGGHGELLGFKIGKGWHGKLPEV